MKPGIHEMPMADYLADPCPVPSLSASTAHTLISRTPLHAWHDHPRLNPGAEREDTAAQDEGTLLHALILERRDIAVMLPFDSYRTKAAQEARDKARADGLIPVLEARLAALVAAAEAARMSLLEHEAAPILDPDRGATERVLIWREGDVWCRARPDWISDDGQVIGDLKTVAGQHGAEPGAFSRGMLAAGHALTAAFYLRGARAVGLSARHYRFVALERDPPHALAVIECAPDLLELADAQVEAAIGTWRECMRRGAWPGYPPRVAHAEAPGWALTDWAERGLRQQQMDAAE